MASLLLQPSFEGMGAGEYYTPAWLFEDLAKKYGPFTLDAAAQADNAKCDRFYDIAADGLAHPWSGVVWCNPPYADVLAWVKKAHVETCVLGNCERSCLLLPATTSTQWFHDYALPHARLDWIRGKVRFGGADRPAMFPTVAVVFDRGGKPSEDEVLSVRVGLRDLLGEGDKHGASLGSMLMSEAEFEEALREVSAGKTERSREARAQMGAALGMNLAFWSMDARQPDWRSHCEESRPRRQPTPKKTARGKDIPEEIKDLLRQGTREGDVYRLPEGQLDRAIYDAAMKVLSGIGFKWDKRAKAHVCGPHGQSERLWEVLDAGKVVDLKQELQFFATPPAVVARVLELADLRPGQRCLEPSAGTGNLAKAMRATVGEEGVVHCCEIHPPFVDGLVAMGFDTWPADFLSIADEEFEPYDRVVMNPPFAKGQDIEHVWRAHRLLKADGVLVSIMHPGWQTGSTKREAAFRDWVKERGGLLEDIEAGAFKESGTEIATVILKVVNDEEGADRVG